MNGVNLTPINAENEVIANFVGEVLFAEDGNGIKAITTDMTAAEKTSFIGYIKRFFQYIKAKLSGNKSVTMEILKLENMFNEVISTVEQKNTAEDSGEKFSFSGYTDDGKGMYKSNFPKGTPKKAKAERILSYIQNVWSKKPIKLNITDSKGNVVKTIEAQFDPTYVEDTRIVTDASKLMGGNRHGTSSEQRVTLDLADDYYQIASESKYNYSKDETGKDKPTHDGVKEWHYFVNDIYFAEYDSDVYKPYTVSINVKEKTDGSFVYSFSAEKNNESNTQQTLHAVMSGENSANVQLTNFTIPQGNSESQDYSMQENQNNSDKKFSIPLNQSNLLDKYESGEITREEYLEQSNENWTDALNEYGSIESGENSTHNIAVPKAVEDGKNTKRFARTIIESGKITADMLEDLGAEILLGNFSYTPISDETAQAKAEQTIS